MIYKSKVDWWIKIIVIGYPIIALVISFIIYSKGNSEAAIWTIGMLILIIAVFAVFVYPINYIIEEDFLLIKYGIHKEKIPYSQILSIKPSRSAQGSPALSMDRLEIIYGNQSKTFISPVEKQQFLKDISEKVTHLKLDNGCLI